jgi:hypothetical protein
MFGLLDRGLWTLFLCPFIISLTKYFFRRIVRMALEIFFKNYYGLSLFPCQTGYPGAPLMVPELHSKKINIFDNEFS